MSVMIEEHRQNWKTLLIDLENLNIFKIEIRVYIVQSHDCETYPFQFFCQFF